MSGYDFDYYGGFPPYVSVAERRRKAAKMIASLQKKGKAVSPVQVKGRKISQSFWSKAWCENLETYSDYASRLPRGRTYLRNGSVIDLQMDKSEITALVSGSSIYTVKISICPLEKSKWQSVIQHCSGEIDSLVGLLQGKFSRGVMEIITCKKRGLFPTPRQIAMECSCPDGAVMCKHVAAVLYGVGVRLDEKPELFFELREVDHLDLIKAATSKDPISKSTRSKKVIKTANLNQLFGIELDGEGEGKSGANRNKKTSPGKSVKRIKK